MPEHITIPRLKKLKLEEIKALSYVVKLESFVSKLKEKEDAISLDVVAYSIVTPSVRIVVVPTENQMGAIGEATNDTFKYRSKRGNHR